MIDTNEITTNERALSENNTHELVEHDKDNLELTDTDLELDFEPEDEQEKAEYEKMLAQIKKDEEIYKKKKEALSELGKKKAINKRKIKNFVRTKKESKRNHNLILFASHVLANQELDLYKMTDEEIIQLANQYKKSPISCV